LAALPAEPLRPRAADQINGTSRFVRRRRADEPGRSMDADPASPPAVVGSALGRIFSRAQSGRALL